MEMSSGVPVSGVLENQQEGLQDTPQGVGMDGGASVGAARADDLGPLVRALDLTLSKKASQCLRGRGD